MSAVAAVLFAAATVLSLVGTQGELSPRRAAVVGVVALLGAAAAWSRRPRLASALLGSAAAGSWLTAVGLGGGEAGLPGLAVVLLACVLAALPRSEGLPRGVGLLVVGIGAVEALRLGLVAETGEGVFLAVGAVVVAGAAGAPGRRGPAVALGLLLVAGAVVQGVRGAHRMASPPTSGADLRALSRLGALDDHAETLAAEPALGLWAVRVDPRAQEVARAVAGAVGPRLVLATGWAPAPEGLSPDARAEIAMLLDGLGRGGEGLRLLRGDRTGRAGWTRLLLARTQGQAPALALASLAPPPGVVRLPGRVALDPELLAPGGATVDVHATAALADLSLEVRSEPGDGAAVLEVSVDGGRWVPMPLPSAGRVAVTGPLDAGPHRLQLVYGAAGPDGSREVQVDALVGSAATAVP